MFSFSFMLYHDANIIWILLQTRNNRYGSQQAKNVKCVDLICNAKQCVHHLHAPRLLIHSFKNYYLWAMVFMLFVEVIKLKNDFAKVNHIKQKLCKERERVETKWHTVIESSYRYTLKCLHSSSAKMLKHACHYYKLKTTVLWWFFA